MTASHLDQPQGIVGLVGREPIGAALTVGIKGANGAPTEKDRFHILDARSSDAQFSKRDGGTYSAPVRTPHPSFAAFNRADAARRTTINARLAHATIAELFEFRYSCQNAKDLPAHPKKAPQCTGNGQRARRWDGQDFRDIACPGEQCQFRQPGPIGFGGRPEKSPCGPWMRFLARFDFPVAADGRGLPAVPFKFTSGSWNTVRNFVGFFDQFRRTCASFGVDPDTVPLFGFQVVITLTEQTNRETKSRFPVVSIAAGGEADVIAWIGQQLSRGRELRQLATRPVLALTDGELHEAEVLHDDHTTISGPLQVPAGAK